MAHFNSYNNPDALVLGDGSISMMVKCPLPNRLCSKYKRHFGEFIERFGEDYVLAHPKMVLESLIQYAEEVEEDDKSLPQLVTCLECMAKEKIAKALFEVAREKKNILYISKSYASNEIFKDKDYNDIFLIDMATRASGLNGPGVVGPYSYTVELPSIGSKVEVLRGFVRFSKGGQVYYFEGLGFDEEELMNTLALVSKICSRGYPVPLILAHEKAELKRSKYLKLLKKTIVGFTGREAL